MIHDEVGVIRIDLGIGSLVSDNISLTPEQADAAMISLVESLALRLPDRNEANPYREGDDE